MTPQRQHWDNESLDDKFAEVDAKLSELDRRQSGLRNTLRNRPTKLQVRRMVAKESGPASNQAVLVAAIGAAAVVIAAVIAGYVQWKTQVPLPVPAPTK